MQSLPPNPNSLYHAPFNLSFQKVSNMGTEHMVFHFHLKVSNIKSKTTNQYIIASLFQEPCMLKVTKLAGYAISSLNESAIRDIFPPQTINPEISSFQDSDLKYVQMNNKVKMGLMLINNTSCVH